LETRLVENFYEKCLLLRWILST